MTTYTVDQIKAHSTQADYWLVMGENVYDLKGFTHPGGWAAHEPYAGGKLDAKEEFEEEHCKLTEDCAQV